MKEYKIVYCGGEGEIVEKKITFYRDRKAGGLGGGSICIYCRDEKEILGCQT